MCVCEIFCETFLNVIVFGMMVNVDLKLYSGPFPCSEAQSNKDVLSIDVKNGTKYEDVKMERG